MRNELKEMDGERSTFTGVFVRFGTKTGFKGTEETILLKNVLDTEGKPVADHLWFNLTKGFEKLGLKAGDKIQFDARVKKYARGFKGRYSSLLNAGMKKEERSDYKLTHPAKIIKL
ncbi:MAG: hypothetical protein ACM3Q2_00520 [Syntrophothermus sp.]